jgi:hypothetical protein
MYIALLHCKPGHLKKGRLKIYSLILIAEPAVGLRSEGTTCRPILSLDLNQQWHDILHVPLRLSLTLLFPIICILNLSCSSLSTYLGNEIALPGTFMMDKNHTPDGCRSKPRKCGPRVKTGCITCKYGSSLVAWLSFSLLQDTSCQMR